MQHANETYSTEKNSRQSGRDGVVQSKTLVQLIKKDKVRRDCWILESEHVRPSGVLCRPVGGRLFSPPHARHIHTHTHVRTHKHYPLSESLPHYILGWQSGDADGGGPSRRAEAQARLLRAISRALLLALAMSPAKPAQGAYSECPGGLSADSDSPPRRIPSCLVLW